MSKFRPGIDIAEFERRSCGRFPEFLGLRMVSVAEGSVRMRLELRPEHLAPNGYLHAAVVVGLADTACGYGTMAHLPEQARGFTTIELKTNFLATALTGALVCDATSVHLGRSTHVWDARVHAEASGQKIALFRCTQMILWPQS
jgi:1,4-dihydroxy-2-naphthoyl-CoA hydrolase